MVLCDVPRPRNANATRQAILEAARERFCAESYDDVGMRDVARDVGVDAALISRYFGSKEDLFLAVLDSCKNGRDLMEGDRADFGQRLATEVVYGEAARCEADPTGEKMRGLPFKLRKAGDASTTASASPIALKPPCCHTGFSDTGRTASANCPASGVEPVLVKR